MFSEMRPVLTDKLIAPTLRGSLFKATVVNVALWGCDTWSLTKKDYEKLRIFQNFCARSMCGINRWHCKEYHITTKSCHEKLGLDNLDSVCKLRQLRMVDKFIFKAADAPKTIFDRMFMAQYEGTADQSRTRVSKTTQETYRDTLQEIFPKASAKEVDQRGFLVNAFKSPKIGERVDLKLNLQPGTFDKGRRISINRAQRSDDPSQSAQK